MTIIIAFVSFLLSFLILFLIRKYLLGNKLLSGDTFFHLLISKSIRENKWKFPSSIKNIEFFESDERYNYLTYPPLLHYIIAMFPVKQHMTIAKYLNLIIFAIIGSLAATITYSLTANFILAIISCLIVILNLSAFDLVSQLSPRPLGILLYSLIVCITVFYPSTIFSLLCISVLVALTCLSHKFAIQALVLGLIPYIIIFNKPVIGIFFLLGFLISIIMSKGFYLRILKEHICWLRFYNFKRKINLIGDIVSIFVRNTWYLQLLVTIFISLLIPNVLSMNNLSTELIFWSFVNLFIAIAVIHPSLKLIGEHNRYVEYSLVPVGITLGLLINNFNMFTVLPGLVSVSLSMLALLKLKKYIVNSKMLITTEDIKVYSTLRGQYKERILVMPSLRTLEFNYFTSLNIVHPVRRHGIVELIGLILDTYKVKYLIKFKNLGSDNMFEKIAMIRQVNKIRDFQNFEMYEIAM